MRIGSLHLQNITVFAPLAGITHLPLRLVAKQAGCGLVCSEMISANGLVHRSQKTLAMLDSDPAEKPLSVQIFGADPGLMAEAARMVQESGADVLDLNFGCAVKKILKTGSGAALMRTPVQAREVLQAVRRAVDIPVTIKIRTGWEPSGCQALALARTAADCGVDAIAVHPRLGTQGFRGQADWAIIKAVKSTVSIPVIGNGDIVQAQDAIRMLAETGCDAVMIGRAAVGNPMIFSQVEALIEGRPMPAVDRNRRLGIMRDYFDASVRYFGEVHACRIMRSRLSWFVKGMRHSSRFREAIKRISTRTQALEVIDAYQAMLNAEAPERGD